MARQFPRKIHFGVDRRRRHARFAQHQKRAVKKKKDADDADRNRQPAINTEQTGDGDRHAR